MEAILNALSYYFCFIKRVSYSYTMDTKGNISFKIHKFTFSDTVLAVLDWEVNRRRHGGDNQPLVHPGTTS